MKVRHKQMVLLLVAALVTAALVVVLDSSAVIGATVGAYLSAAAAYTALDLRAIIKATGELPKGQFQRANQGKYLVAALTLVVLLAVVLFKQERTGIDLELAIGVLGPGVIALIAIVIGGIKTNKAATLTEGHAP